MSSLMTDSAKSSLVGEKNPNRVRMNLMLDNSIAEQDGVIAVRYFVTMAMAVMTVDNAE